MVLFLYGPDTFRSKKKLQEIVNRYCLKYKSGLNLAKIEASSEGFEQLKERIETTSMFKEKKLIIFKNVFSTPAYLQEKVEKYLIEKNIFKDENLILIFFQEGEIQKPNELFKLLFERSFKKQEFKELPIWKLKIFIRKYWNCKIDNRAIEKLILSCGNNLWEIESELEKIIAFKKGEKITDKDIENLSPQNIQTNIFKTLDLISQKNKKRALKLLFNHLEKGENEIKLLSMMIFQFRNILKIKNLIDQKKSLLQIQKLSGLHPFLIKKISPIVQNFSIEELKKIYQKLLELDFKIKSGRVDAKTGIEMFIAEL